MLTARDAFLVCVLMLLSTGLLMVFSASITSRPSMAEQTYLLRHLTFLGIALACGTTAALLPISFWKRISPVLFALTLVLLVTVLIPGIGTEVNGARRWLRFGPLSLQPSELAKLSLPLFLCWIIDRRRDARGQIVAVVPPFIPVAVLVFLVLQEPDLGTALFLCLTAAVCLLVADWPIWQFVLAGGCVAPLAAGVVALRPYQWERIQGFVTTWLNPSETPYQVRQSLTTLGAGGWNGMGLGRGSQKLSFLPEPNTDFVYAVVGEELGLLGTLGIGLLWLALLAVGLRMLLRLPKTSFAFVAGTTLLVQLILQAVINAGVVTALLPTTGIPHPLLSYGGSSLLVSVVSVGIVLSCASSAAPDRAAATHCAGSDRNGRVSSVRRAGSDP
jgi:cell division protein FtsW